MGKFNSRGNQNIYQELPPATRHSHVRPITAYFEGRLYYAVTNDTLREYRLQNARLLADPVSQTALTFGYPGTTPSVSADGPRNGIVWAVENVNFTYDAGYSNPAVLHAYDASNLARELYNSDQAPAGRDHFGIGNKFITPMIAHGKVYVGTTGGVGVFGLLSHR